MLLLKTEVREYVKKFCDQKLVASDYTKDNEIAYQVRKLAFVPERRGLDRKSVV